MSFEPCMCGADDCSRCHPGYTPPPTCDECYSDVEKVTEVYDGEKLCDGCLEEYRECCWCSEWHKFDEVTHIKEHGEDVCKDCIDDYKNADNAECRSDK